MKEVFGMWKNTRMVILTALVAALYAALLIPFKGFVLIPGITELRPGVVIPVISGLLFGPAGAWGAAIGNSLADLFGTLPGLVIGFIGNFFLAYVPYKLWNKLGLVKMGERDSLLPNSAARVVNFIIVTILGALACALFIAWSVDLLGVAPFAAVGTLIALNNSIVAVVLGVPLMLLLYPRVKKWGLLWTDIMDKADLPHDPPYARAGALLMAAGILVGFFGGLSTALGLADQLVFAAGYLQGITGTPGVAFTAGIGLLLMIVGGLLQR